MITPANSANDTATLDLAPGTGSTVVIGLSLISLGFVVAIGVLEFVAPAASQLAGIVLALR